MDQPGKISLVGASRISWLALPQVHRTGVHFNEPVQVTVSGQSMTGIRVFACAGQSMHLKCETVGHRIHIASAFYGRHTASPRCAPASRPSCDNKTANDITERVDLSCSGFSTCTIQVCMASLGVDLRSICGSNDDATGGACTVHVRVSRSLNLLTRRCPHWLPMRAEIGSFSNSCRHQVHTARHFDPYMYFLTLHNIFL